MKGATTLALFAITLQGACTHSATDKKDSLKIIGGTPADPELIKSVVAIYDNEGEFQCTGSYLCTDTKTAKHQLWFVTAAHCPDPAKISFGPDTKNTTLECAAPSTFVGQRHSLYKKVLRFHANDVAYYQVSCLDTEGEPIDVTEKTSCIPWDQDPEFLQEKTDVMAVGYGKTGSARVKDDATFGTLLQVPLQVTKLYQSRGGLIERDDLRFSTGIADDWNLKEQGVANTCHGDSGGPAFVQDANGYKLVGILSSSTCDRARAPYAGWSQSAAYVDWILSIPSGEETTSAASQDSYDELVKLEKINEERRNK